MKQTDAITSYCPASSCTAVTPLSNTLLAAIWVTILLFVNFPLISGEVRSQLIFFPDDTAAGKWWQLLTHPFVHLSWYHLILDGLAFVILYLLLEEKRNSIRLFYCTTAAMGALFLSLLLEPAISQQGLCGLSGAAHGLMAISALEMLYHKSQKNLGLLCLGIVVTKSLYELSTGHVFLESLHLGQTGQPLVASHAGGIVGGLLAFAGSKIWHCRFVRRTGRNNECKIHSCFENEIL